VIRLLQKEFTLVQAFIFQFKNCNIHVRLSGDYAVFEWIMPLSVFEMFDVCHLNQKR